MPKRSRSGVVKRPARVRSEEHTSELQSLRHLVCRLLLEKKKKNHKNHKLAVKHYFCPSHPATMVNASNRPGHQQPACVVPQTGHATSHTYPYYIHTLRSS